jgi:hypothetical protein
MPSAEERAIARKMLEVAEGLLSVRAEVLKLDKAGHPAVAGEVGARRVRKQALRWANTLLELAARLALTPDRQP